MDKVIKRKILPPTMEVMPPKGLRQKTYKRELSFIIFAVCLGWYMWSGSIPFLEVTFIPTLFLVASAFGLQEFSTNMKGFWGRKETNYEEPDYEETTTIEQIRSTKP
jgi:hypothetical protein